MALELPAQLYATTLYDRHQKQSLSFVFLPASSLHNGYVPPLDQLWYQLEPTATYRREITASYLPAALASLLSSDSTNPFAWVDQAPTNVVPAGAPIWIHPNSLGFAEY